MLKVSELYIYPIKSLGGIKVDRAKITDRGFEFDRRWMLIDNNNRFLSQRENAKLALLKVQLMTNGLQITDSANGAKTIVPYQPQTKTFLRVVIWDDTCTGQLVSEKADQWFSDALAMDCRLVYMPDDSERPTDQRYTPQSSLTSFSDAYPFMVIGQASLDDLNKRLPEALPIDRFRPNIVFAGGEPYEEDTMDDILINGIKFTGVKLCARCNIPTIDQNNISKSKEPTKTLATYRAKNKKVYLGQNLICKMGGAVCIGDEILVLTRHTDERFMI